MSSHGNGSSHVSMLSHWARRFVEQPYPPGYDFPLPFGRRLSLLGTSSSCWGQVFSLPPTGLSRFAGSRCDRIGWRLYRREFGVPELSGLEKLVDAGITCGILSLYWGR